MTPRSLIPRSREEILAMHRVYEDEELSLRAVGERYGLSAEGVRQCFGQYDLPTRRAGGTATRRREESRREAQERGEEIRAAYREHGNVEAVTKLVKLPRQWVVAVIDAMPDREIYRRRGSNGLQRSEAALIDDLKRAAQATGEPLTIPNYRSVAPQLGLASDHTQRAHFGDWALACKAAGVQSNPGLGERSTNITAEQCIAAVRQYCAHAIALGDRARYGGYEEWAKGKDVPSGATVRARVGWNNALRAALDAQAESAL